MHRHARRTLVDQKAGYLFAFASAEFLFTGDREENHIVRGFSVADEMLAAIDDVVAAVAYRMGSNAHRVRTGARFGQREAVHQFAAHVGFR